MTTASRVRLRLVGEERLVASVRRGDAAAFEALYDRHSTELLSFCVYMLGSRHDAEDAVQATFASAYRSLRADRRSVTLRPWLFAIARNNCLSILRRRRPWVELDGEPATDGDPLRELELREEVRQMIEGLRALPESQRASLVLAELHGFSQTEIGTVLGVQADQVKAFICQARSNLISDRTARETDCGEIREELATARGAALLRGRLRRHIRSCDDCRTYADGVARQRRHLSVLLPLAPSLMLKYRALEDALGSGVVADPAGYAGSAAVGGTAVAGTAVEMAGGGFKALAVKIAAGLACLGTGAGAGASVLMAPPTPPVTTHVATFATAADRGWRAPGPAAEAELLREEGRSRAPGRSSAGGEGEPGRRRTISSEPGQGVAGGSESGVSDTTEAARQRREARERRGEEQQRQAEAEHRNEREQRPLGPTAQRLAEQQRARAERLASIVPRVRKTEEERLRAHEGHRPERVSKPPKTKEEKVIARRERKPERVSKPPRTESEREKAREERRRRHEEKVAEGTG